jgi:hypothetical protein
VPSWVASAWLAPGLACYAGKSGLCSGILGRAVLPVVASERGFRSVSRAEPLLRLLRLGPPHPAVLWPGAGQVRGADPELIARILHAWPRLPDTMRSLVIGAARPRSPELIRAAILGRFSDLTTC